jgi:hypothetical protein
MRRTKSILLSGLDHKAGRGNSSLEIAIPAQLEFSCSAVCVQFRLIPSTLEISVSNGLR